MPDLVKHLERIAKETDAEAAMRKCADVCVDLATGRYDVLSGRYIDVKWDLDAIAREAASGIDSPPN